MELFECAGLSREAEGAVVPVDGRAFLGHEVEPVAHGVDEQHVVARQSCDAALIIVAGVEHDWLPVARRPPLVDARRGVLHLLAVCQVLGQPLARGVEHGHEDHSLTPLRPVGEQRVVRVEAPHDVLRRVDAIRPKDEAPVAGDLVERCNLGSHGFRGCDRVERLTINAQRGAERGGDG